MRLNLYTKRKCEGKISRYHWTLALLSMIFHPTRPEKWRFFTFTEVTDLKYSHYDHMNVPIDKVCLGEYYKEGMNKWVRNHF